MFFTTLVCSLGAVGRNTNEKTFEKLIGKLCTGNHTCSRSGLNGDLPCQVVKWCNSKTGNE